MKRWVGKEGRVTHEEGDGLIGGRFSVLGLAGDDSVDGLEVLVDLDWVS